MIDQEDLTDLLKAIQEEQDISYDKRNDFTTTLSTRRQDQGTFNSISIPTTERQLGTLKVHKRKSQYMILPGTNQKVKISDKKS